MERWKEGSDGGKEEVGEEEDNSKNGETVNSYTSIPQRRCRFSSRPLPQSEYRTK